MQNIKNKNIKWWIGVSSCFMLFAFIGVFAYMKLSFIIKGVNIEAQMQHEGSSSLVTIYGNARNATYLSLNGREIFIDKDGTFSEKIALLPGFSVVTVDALDKFGNNKEKKFQVIYEESSGSFAFNNID